jgi:SAM-dependent methyltransferase
MSKLPTYPLPRRWTDPLAYRLRSPAGLAARERRREERSFRALLRAAQLPTRPVPLGPVPRGRVSSCTWGRFTDPGGTRVEEERFFTLGFQLMNRFLRALDAAGVDLRAVRSFFELGVGGGRLIRLLRGVGAWRLVGSDVDAESVDWCRRHLPGPEYHVNPLLPPLPFAKDGSFDVACAAGVFSCIAPEDLPAWIAEMSRVVRPGGIFLCTVLSPDAPGRYLGPDAQATADRDGLLVLPASDTRASATAKLTGTRDVYLSRDRVDALFGARFEPLAREPLAGQDLLVLRVPR